MVHARRGAARGRARGGSFEERIAAQLGDARARELRVAQDGWPGLKFQTGARCPD